ncbi:S8 family serine peptidase [Vibrio natriegens]|uniref:S8 family serine peptidase n=1 Tax=Vibrio natriegens TaxID=691 RepID=UPI001EFE1B05|nr:S8 family serine peptidase [Vibrio natriegens]MCG9702965.1 S8 family serine peptidase [Vibrio natriegens]
MESLSFKARLTSCIVALSCCSATALANQIADDGRVKDRYIIEFKGKSLADVTDANESAHLEDIQAEQNAFRSEAKKKKLNFKELSKFNRLVNGVSIEANSETIKAFEKFSMVKAIHPEYVYFSGEEIEEAVPDATRETITVTNLTGVPEAHAAGFTGKGITACVVDSGIDTEHPAFAGKILGGYDFAEGDSDYSDSGYHGTHVAGILAGNGPNMVGVAPDAKLRIYKVFGGENSGYTSTILNALEQAVADDCDVVNMSLGSIRGGVIQKSILPKAVDKLAVKDIAPVVSIGNASAGPFLPAAPAIAKKSTAVASAIGSYYDAALAFKIDDLKVPFVIANNSSVPLGGSSEVINYGAFDCDVEPVGPFEGKTVLVKKPKGSIPYSCTSKQAALLEREGAGAIIWWDEPLYDTDFWLYRWASNMIPYKQNLSIPVAKIRPIDVPALEAKIEAGETTVIWGDYVSIDNPYANTPSITSTWGPTHELDFKPEVMAPGERIYSAMPSQYAHYGFLTGTSMASPHVAGITALMKSANSKLKPGDIRNILMNTAQPQVIGWTGEVGPASTALQGAGMVNALQALTTEVTALPAKFAIGDLNGHSFDGSIELNNDSDQTLTFNVRHEAALTAAPPMTQRWIARKEAAEVTFNVDQIEVSASGNGTVYFSITEPTDVPEGSVISGWIVFDAVETGQIIRVPYLGLKGDYHALPVENETLTEINPSMSSFFTRPEAIPNCSGPVWTQSPCCNQTEIAGSCGPSYGPGVPVTLDFTNDSAKDDTVFMGISQAFPMLRKFKAQVLNNKGKVIAPLGWRNMPEGVTMEDVQYMVRTSGAGTGLEFGFWDGKLADGTDAPAGEYIIKLEFHKLLGENDMSPDIETWESHPITLTR